MTYKVGVPPLHEAVASEIHTISNYKNVHYVTCYKVLCHDCLRQDGLYKVCPLCGSTLRDNRSLYTCTCGSLLFACRGVVTRFVVPCELFEDELVLTEDVI